MKFTKRIKKISVLVTLGTVLITAQAVAVAPLLMYGAVALAGIAITTIGMTTAVNGINNLQARMKPGSFSYTPSGNQTVTQAVIAPPNSNIGARADFVVDYDALKEEMFKDSSASKYPKTRQALVDNDPNKPISNGSWGVGDEFDASKMPGAGDAVVLPDGTTRTTTNGPSVCTIMPSDTSHPDLVNVQSRKVGSSGCYRSGCSIFYVWTGCRGTISSTGKTTYGVSYNFGSPSSSSGHIDLSKYTDEQIRAAMSANPDEVNEAQRAVYEGLHGTVQSEFPSSSSPAHFIDPTTGLAPKAADIARAISEAAQAQSAGTASPVPGTSSGNSTTTTTIPPNSVTVETAPDGTRTVTIPKTITVTGADGNIISETTTSEVLTYPPGVAIPQHIQDVINGSASGTATTVDSPSQTTTTVTTTVAPGSVTVTTDAEGTRTVSIPKTTVITDADGNVISTTTTTQVLTYPDGVAIPQAVQDTIDASDAGVEQTVEESESKTEDLPPDLSTPDLSTINLEPILNASKVLQGKFPFSFIGLITQIFDDLSTTPEIPDFDVDLGSLGTMTVSFQWMESTASFFRLIMGAVVILFCAWESIKIWV